MPIKAAVLLSRPSFLIAPGLKIRITPGRQDLILGQNVKLAKLPLNVLYTLGAERVGITVPPALYGTPAIVTGHDRNGN
jgi:hypothetical protein